MASITKRVFAVVVCIIVLYVATLFYLSHAVVGPHLPHVDFVDTDEVIIILGYKLHEDSMPTRVLRNRVEKAVESYHHLIKNNHHPLLIVSGKGKSDYDYTEAQIMKELAIWMGVRSEDIWVDADSTNTVQNALFSASLIQNKRIDEAFIVTSDYHMVRAQYIFQTVFPSNISLVFVASETSAEKREKERQIEKEYLKTAQEDFIKLSILDRNESYGYHPLRNAPRWNMIEREINDDLKLSKKDDHRKHMAIVDYGSNYGYFSLHLAQKLPEATILSVEGEAWKEYAGAASFHAKKMSELSIINNFLCATLVAPATFGELHQAAQVFDYQLSLSVFHWFVPMNTREIFEQTLSNHLLNARTTFIELPEAMNYTGKEGQHMGKRVAVWYEGRSEEQVLEGVARKYNLQAKVKTLGAIPHTTGTVRKVIRVDVLDNRVSKWDKQKLFDIYKCKQIKGGKA